jgi:uncharacterized iron-regulated membrane protein
VTCGIVVHLPFCTRPVCLPVLARLILPGRRRGPQPRPPRRRAHRPSYIATFEPASVFGDLVTAEGIRRGTGHARQLTILGDGAA